MSDRRDDLDEAEGLAAEYAAGLLDGTDLAEARKRIASDADFARDVARWRGRLAGLQDGVTAVDPPASLWQRIEAQLGRPIVANDNDGALRRKLVLWRSAAAGFAAMAAAFATVLLLQPPRTTVISPAPAPVSATPMVAMVGDNGAAKLMVSWDPAAKQLVMALAGPMPGDAAHSHELWVIPADGTPRSLGVMGGEKQAHKRLADAIANLLQQGATIAVSVEPRGGSPTGKPTGPVIASGSLTEA